MFSRGRKLNGAAVTATLLLISCTPLTQTNLPTDAGSSCRNSLSASEFDGWFETGAVSLNGAVKPANSVLFPDTPNCSFYKWSEQMFLWLTSPAGATYGGRGLVMNSSAFYDVSLPDPTLPLNSPNSRHFIAHTSGEIRAFNLRTAQLGMLNLPIILERKTLRMLEILPPVLGPTGRQLVADSAGRQVEVGSIRFTPNQTPVLLDPNGNAIESPRAIMRAAGDTVMRPFERTLRLLKVFDRSELVEKITIGERFVLLDLFGHFIQPEQGQADGGVLMAQNGSLVYYGITVNNVFALYRTMLGATVPAGTRFPVTQADLNTITAFAVAHGHSPVVDSEALAIEIKTSWVEAAGLTDADKFIQLTGIVPTYDKTNPNDWVPNGTKTVKLALVGMHIVGSTGSTNPLNSVNHGHPEMLWATFEHVSNDPAAEYSYTSTSGVKTVPQNTAGNWVFSANGATGPFNEMRMRMGGPSGDHIVANTFATPPTIGPSNVLRVMPWGMPGGSALSNAEVLSLNGIVRSLLDPNDIRRNYFHEGTTWSPFGGDPNVVGAVGTSKLENTTLETFFQGNNCFSCHGTNTTSVSHVFNFTAPLF